MGVKRKIKLRSVHTVVITRPDGESFAQSLRSAGFLVILLPLFSVTSCDGGYSAESLKKSISETDWLIFTSRNGVRFFSAMVGDELPEGLRVAAIGARSAQAFCDTFGRSVDYQGEGQSSEDFAPGLFERVRQGQRMLLITAREHRGVIAAEARVRGVALDTVALYQREPREIPPGVLESLRARAPRQTLWPFFSPSAFHECIVRSDELKALISEGRIFSIGDTTTRSIRESGFEVFAQAEKASETGMLEQLVKSIL